MIDTFAELLREVQSLALAEFIIVLALAAVWIVYYGPRFDRYERFFRAKPAHKQAFEDWKKNDTAPRSDHEPPAHK